MLKINDLLPLNLQEEKVKFFASGYTYNPQFIYEKEVDQDELTQYGKPKWWLLWQARWILHKYLRQQKSDLTKKMINSEKHFLSPSEIKQILEKHLSKYSLDKIYLIKFSEDFVSRISVNLKDKLIKVRLPIQIEKDEISAVIAHEIDTHVLRQHNSSQQIWHGKKKKYGLSSHSRTEEGLAIINEMIAAEQNIAYKSAINYLAVDLAIKNDFKKVFSFFVKLWNDPERAWIWTVKKKRGLTDTNQKGAFTKDLIYFEGLMKVLKYLKRNNYDPSLLYVGKIAVEDVEKLKKINTLPAQLLPPIFTDNPKLYKQKVKQLIKNNFLL
jgi:hypothetical protein